MWKTIMTAHRDVILYLFFGGCTAVVNLSTYWIGAHVLDFGILPSTVIAWCLAVLFAYATNRIWVFHGESHGIQAITKEMVMFIGCRLGTGGLDCLCMFVFAECLQMNDLIVKIEANILVAILNYVASKWFIFK